MEKEVTIHSSILAWKNPMNAGAWRAPVHGAAKSWTGLSNQPVILYCFVLSTWKLKENSPWVSLFPLRAYVQIYTFLHIRYMVGRILIVKSIHYPSITYFSLSVGRNYAYHKKSIHDLSIQMDLIWSHEPYKAEIFLTDS